MNVAPLAMSTIGFGLGLGLVFYAFVKQTSARSRYRRLQLLELLRAAARRSPALWRWLGRTWPDGLEHKLRMAGYPLGLRASDVQFARLLLICCLAAGGLASRLLDAGQAEGIGRILLFRCGLAFLLVWFGPLLLLELAVRRRRTRLLYELTRLSHRLGMVVGDETDLRDALLHAGRTCRLLQPYLTELATGWNVGQYAAIVAFGEAIGLTEAYPLVNALLAASRVEACEVAVMLEQQVESIDRSMEHETSKRIENVPLYLVLLIMLPFMVVFVLMVYPWMTYMSDLLLQAF